MAGGRPAKPLEQRAREGNPGNRRLPDGIKLKPNVVPKPDGLPAAAAEMWDRLVVGLGEAGVAGMADAPALEAMCIQWHRGKVARAILAKQGMVTTGSTGQMVEHPALAIEREAHRLYLRFAQEYGLTAAARAKIAALFYGGGGDDADDELDGIIDTSPAELEQQ